VGIAGFKEPTNARVQQIVDEDILELNAEVMQSREMMVGGMNPSTAPEVLNEVVLPSIVRKRYPELDEEEVDQVKQHVLGRAAVIQRAREFDGEGSNKFVEMARNSIDLNKLNVDLISQINICDEGYEILSKTISRDLLGTLKSVIHERDEKMTIDEARALWPRLQKMLKAGKKPDPKGDDPIERKLHQALITLQRLKADQGKG